jgi:hypothetical protein
MIVGSLRDYPFPFSALLAISSDLDGTRTWQDYIDLIRFLNTTDTTIHGAGLGLEFANSIYFDAAPGQFSYWSASEPQREALDALIRSGHVDTLHSFGDLARSGSDLRRSLSEIGSRGYSFPVWVDHSRATTNLGKHHTRGYGDIAGHEAYHVAELRSLGLTHCWLGQVTGRVASTLPLRPLSRGAFRTSAESMRLAGLKENVKVALAALGSSRYSLHGNRPLMARYRLRDDTELFEFIRCNPSPQGVAADTTAEGLAESLSHFTLQQLVSRRGAMILYTHLGRRMPEVGTRAHQRIRATLEEMAELQRNDQLLILTTSRLLDYLASRDHAEIRTQFSGARLNVSIRSMMGDSLTRTALLRSGGAGLTICIGDAEGADVFVEGRIVDTTEPLLDPQTGSRFVMLPLKPLGDVPTAPR